MKNLHLYMERLSSSERIVKVIEFTRLSYNAFAKKVGRSNSQYLRDIVNGITKNITDKVAKEIIKAFPEINYDWLITGVGEMINSNPVIKNSVAAIRQNYNSPAVITVDQYNNENIVFVPVKARAGYLQGYYNSAFIEKLPTFCIPGLNNGTFRAFEVKGNSMNLTIHNKSIAIGQWVEDIRDIKDGRIYVIVYDDGDKMEDGIIIKRCLNRIEKYGNLICKSDTLDRESYPNINIEPSSIKEAWEVKGAITFEFQDPSEIFQRVNNLEAEIEIIKQSLKK